MENAKQLADLYYRKGFTEVEAKAGQHYALQSFCKLYSSC